MRLFDDVAPRVADPYLRRALELAEHGRGATSPNPAVGCVIVRDGAVVGEGFHPRAGEPHAEVFALSRAGGSARGATAYVTLEPCNHHGKTPPCVDALIAAGVARVVVGMPDPDPVASGGTERLRAAGVEVAFADDPRPFQEINEGWLKRIATGVPLVTAKVALSLDGHPGLDAGVRSSITGTSGAMLTRELRRRVDAVLVGSATVVADDPELTVRDATGARAEHQPLRVVLVHRTLPPRDSRLFTDGLAPTLVLVSDDFADDAALGMLPGPVLVERFAADRGLMGALAVLGSRGVSDVLVEPGPRLMGALWAEADLPDVLVTASAGGMAGDRAPALFTGAADREDQTLVRRMKPVETGIVGDVSVTVWRPSGADDVQ